MRTRIRAAGWSSYLLAAGHGSDRPRLLVLDIARWCGRLASPCAARAVRRQAEMPAEDTSNRSATDLADPAAAEPVQSAPSRPSSVRPVETPVLTADDKTIISKRPPLAAGAVPFGGSPQAMGDTLIGRRLEHYELNEFVGGGGMAAAFRATDRRLGR